MGKSNIRNFFEGHGSSIIYDLFHNFDKNYFSTKEAAKITDIEKVRLRGLLKRLTNVDILEKEGKKYKISPERVMNLNVGQYYNPGSDLKRLIQFHLQNDPKGDLEKMIVNDKSIEKKVLELNLVCIKNLFNSGYEWTSYKIKEESLIKLCGACMQPETFNGDAKTNRDRILKLIIADTKFNKDIRNKQNLPSYKIQARDFLKFVKDYYSK